MFDFKEMARICDQMKKYRDITKAIYEVKVNPDPHPHLNSKATQGADTSTSPSSQRSAQKSLMDKPPSNPNVGNTPVTLVFRNKNYKSRKIDVLRCEIANTKHLPGGRLRIYITQGKTDQSYYLLIQQVEEGKEVYYLERHEFEIPEPLSKVKLDKSLIRHTIWVPDV